MVSVRKLVKPISVVCILFAMVLSGCADPNFLDKTRKDQSILKGTPVELTSELSQQVVMIVKDLDLNGEQPTFFGPCSGVLISARVVLTAAHCIARDISKMRVIINPNPRQNLKTNTSDIFKISNYRIHKNFNHSDISAAKDPLTLALYTDLAVIYLDRTSEKIQPVDLLIGKDFTASSYNITLAGFGRTTSLQNDNNLTYDQMNGRLYQTSTTLPAPNESETYFSLDQWESSGVCNGDSGAPVFITNPNTRENSLYALSIDVFKYKDQLAERDVENLHTICAGHGLFLILAPHQQWIYRSIEEFKSSPY